MLCTWYYNLITLQLAIISLPGCFKPSLSGYCKSLLCLRVPLGFGCSIISDRITSVVNQLRQGKRSVTPLLTLCLTRDWQKSHIQVAVKAGYQPWTLSAILHYLLLLMSRQNLSQWGQKSLYFEIFQHYALQDTRMNILIKPCFLVWSVHTSNTSEQGS